MILGAPKGKIFIKAEGNPRPRSHQEKNLKSQGEGQRAIDLYDFYFCVPL
jgi:hypothetical protein